MRRHRTREAARIDRAVRRAGGEVTLTRRGHLRVAANGRVTIVGSKLDDPRALLNALADIRRSTGLQLSLRPE